MANTHIYILDTCVVLHDPLAFEQFGDNDVYLPLSVIDDLDDIKTRREPSGWAAREVFRYLARKCGDGDIATAGIQINEEGGRLFLHNPFENLPEGEMPDFTRRHSDTEIIKACFDLKAQFPDRKVAIVSKDAGLRIRARCVGCEAENYLTDLVGQRYGGVRRVTVYSAHEWATVNQPQFEQKELSGVASEALLDVVENEFVVFVNGSAEVVCWYRDGLYRDVRAGFDKKVDFMGVKPVNTEQWAAFAALNAEDIPLVVLEGKAGTGKTLSALAVGMQKVMDGLYERIIVIKPNVPVGGVDIGALPGTKEEKLYAWLGPIRDNMEQLVAKRSNNSKRGGDNDNLATFEDWVQRGKLEMEAMAYIQGRSMPNSYIIVDEVENLTPRVTEMVVSRCGKNSKMVLLGDITQVESPFLDARSNGLAHVAAGAKGNRLCAVVNLEKVERSALAAAIGDIFKRPGA